MLVIHLSISLLSYFFLTSDTSIFAALALLRDFISPLTFSWCVFLQEFTHYTPMYYYINPSKSLCLSNLQNPLLVKFTVAAMSAPHAPYVEPSLILTVSFFLRAY